MSTPGWSGAWEELAVLNEQLAVVQESADEACVRALVSETPLASQEHNEAARHADAMLRRTMRSTRSSAILSPARTSSSPLATAA